MQLFEEKADAHGFQQKGATFEGHTKKHTLSKVKSFIQQIQMIRFLVMLVSNIMFEQAFLKILVFEPAARPRASSTKVNLLSFL